MNYKGFILHQSRCTSINGKGFDFWVDVDGAIYAAPLLTDPSIFTFAWKVISAGKMAFLHYLEGRNSYLPQVNSF